MDSYGPDVTEARLQHLGGQIEVIVSLALHESSIRCVCAESEVLRWLALDREVAVRIQSELDGEILRLISNTPDTAQPGMWQSMKDRVGGALHHILADYDIDLDVAARLAVVVQHPSPWLHHPWQLPDGVSWVSYDEHALRNCATLGYSHLGMASSDLQLYFSPDPKLARSSFAINPTCDFLLDAVELLIDGEVVATMACASVVRRGPQEILVPVLAVRLYPRVQAGARVCIRLRLGDGRALDLDSVRCGAQSFAGGVASIFIDMGSTTTKACFLKSSVAAVPILASEFRSEVLRVLDAVIRGEDGAVSAWAPGPTSTFVERFGIPHYDKAALARAPDEVLARWVASAMRALIIKAAEVDRAVRTVVWSFPEVDGRDIVVLERAVRILTDDFVLGQVTLLAEHDALRHRFSAVLGELAQAASASAKARSDAMAGNEWRAEQRLRAERQYERAHRAYTEKFFLIRWFSTQPSPPNLSNLQPVQVPTLEDWHQSFVEIEVVPDLRDVVILDAGGYSLDVFCAVGGAEFGKSFSAGGIEIDGHLLKQLRAQRTSSEDHVLWYAEQRKIEICNARDESGTLARAVRDKQLRYTRPHSTRSSTGCKAVSATAGCH